LKHIKKKFLFERDSLPVKKGAETQNVDRKDSQTLKKVKNNTVPFIKTTEGKYIWGTHYNHKGKQLIIPLPDLTLAYYDFAYQGNKIRQEYEKKMFDKLNSTDEITEDVSNELYHYFGFASSCLIGMFTCIESFMNQILPANFVYVKKSERKTELFDKEQIQRSMSFDEKFKKILPELFNKKYDLSKSEIPVLKKLRDDIVHTKSKNDFTLQEDLIKKVLNFKYEECLIEIRSFINFYQNNYIEECDCGKDF